MAAKVSAPEIHPAEATKEAVEAKASDARSEAIKLVQASSAQSADDADSGATSDASPADSAAEAKPAEAADESAAKRIAWAMRWEKQGAKLREQQKAAEARDAQLREREQQIDARVKELEGRLERYKLLEADPVKAFEELKIDPKAFLERLAGEHDPAKVVDRRIEAERSERERLAREFEEFKKAAAEREESVRRVAYEQQLAQAEVDGRKLFISHLEDNAEKYPHLIGEFTPDEVATKAWQLAVQHSQAYFKEFGEYPDDSVFAEHLEAEAAKRAEARSAWRARLKKPSEPGVGTASGQPLKPRTLTNGAASTKATAPKAWNEKDARADAIKLVAQMLSSDSE